MPVELRVKVWACCAARTCSFALVNMLRTCCGRQPHKTRGSCCPRSEICRTFTFSNLALFLVALAQVPFASLAVPFASSIRLGIASAQQEEVRATSPSHALAQKHPAASPSPQAPRLSFGDVKQNAEPQGECSHFSALLLSPCVALHRTAWLPRRAAEARCPR